MNIFEEAIFYSRYGILSDCDEYERSRAINMCSNVAKYTDFWEKEINQILNYSSNTFFDNHLKIFFEKYIDALKTVSDHSEDFDSFKKSLDNSKFLLDKKSTKDFVDKILDLKPNNKSFLIIPLVSENHLFSSVVYRKDDYNFEFVLVNKGQRSNHHTFEKYTVPLKNIKKVCSTYQTIAINLNKMGFSDYVKKAIFRKSTENIYNIFSKNSSSIDILKDLDAKDQIIDNCYTKSLEIGIKYACYLSYGTAMNYNNIQTPKFPVDTQEFHIKILEQIKLELEQIIAEDYSNLSESAKVFAHYKTLTNSNAHDFVKEFCKEKASQLMLFVTHKIDIYEKNKLFRKHMKNLEGKTFEEKKQEIFKIYNVTNFDDFKTSVLSFIDSRTFETYMHFFTNLLSENSRYIPESLMPYKYEFREGIFSLIYLQNIIVQNNVEFLEFFTENFQEIGTELCLSFIQKMHLLKVTCYPSSSSNPIRRIWDPFWNGFILSGFNKRYLSQPDRFSLPYTLEFLLEIDEDKLKNNLLQGAISSAQIDEDKLKNNLPQGDISSAQNEIIKTVLSYRKLILSPEENVYVSIYRMSPENNSVDSKLKSLLNINNYTLIDIEQAISLLSQVKKPQEKYATLISKISSTLQNQNVTFRLTKYKFINKLLFKLFSRKFNYCLSSKLLRFKFFDLLEDKDNALKECDNILSLLKDVGQSNNIVYTTIQFRKATILSEVGKINDAEKELLKLYKETTLGHARKVRNALMTISKSKTSGKTSSEITLPRNITTNKVPSISEIEQNTYLHCSDLNRSNII